MYFAPLFPTRLGRVAFGNYTAILKMHHSTSTADVQQMRAWQTSIFGASLALNTVERPRLWRDDQVLIRVEASSINPIDVRMAGGYGNEILSRWREAERANWNPVELARLALGPTPTTARLPLTTGRDLSGEIVQIGARAGANVRLGDKVIAVVPPHWQGAHAEYVVLPCDAVALRPSNLSASATCAHVYTACTMWSALSMARVNATNASNFRFLIHGGSGGMGTTTIQFLRAWGVQKIVATCSAKNLDLVRQLGATAIDYTSPTAQHDIIDAGPYEVVLQYAGGLLVDWSDSILGIWRNCVHVSLISPLLADTDRYGLPVGLASTFIKYIARSAQPVTQGRWFTYAFFWPSGECLRELSTLMEQEKFVPIIEKCYKFEELPEAYDKVGKIHGCGKSVMEIT